MTPTTLKQLKAEILKEYDEKTNFFVEANLINSLRITSKKILVAYGRKVAENVKGFGIVENETDHPFRASTLWVRP